MLQKNRCDGVREFLARPFHLTKLDNRKGPWQPSQEGRRRRSVRYVQGVFGMPIPRNIEQVLGTTLFQTDPASGRFQILAAVTIEDGAHKVLDGHFIGYHNIDGVHLLSQVSQTQRNSKTRISLQNIGNFFDALERLSTHGNYRSAKTDQFWREVYGVTQTMVTYVPTKHNKNKNGAYLADSVACRRCGLILPLTAMTIDHQKPQEGGGMLAVCRLFRALGLTTGAPKGAKPQRLLENYANAVGGTQKGEGGGSRTTLDHRGCIYYSLVFHAKLFDWFVGECMHSLANLRPLCGRCNSRIGNAGAFD